MGIYRKFNPMIDSKIEEMLYPDNTYNEEISFKDIAIIEYFYKKNGYVNVEDVDKLLNYITAYSRLAVLRFSTPVASTMSGLCYPSAEVNYEVLKKMGFNPKMFNIGRVIGIDNTIHELCEVKIPIMINDEIIDKDFILDPTFKQFCTKEGCSINRYNGEKRFNIKKATPLPAYFMFLSEEGMTFTKNLTKYGYFEKTDELFKRYCDAFKLFTMEKEDYEDQSLVGKLDFLDTLVSEYQNNLDKANDLPMGSLDIIIKTPLEAYQEYERKSKKRFLNTLKEKYLKEHTKGMLKPEYKNRR